MFQNPVALSGDRHRTLKYRAPENYSFVQAEVLCPVFGSELGAVAREFPIVFPKQNCQPCALLGVEAGVNAYVGGDGRWLAHYVPNHIRRYPFGLAKAGEGTETEQRYTIAFDSASTAIGEAGEPLFNEDGTYTDTLKDIVALLEAMEKQARALTRIGELLQEKELLVDSSFVVKRQGKPDSGVRGIRVVDEAKLAALSDDDFLALRSAQALPVIYAHLISMANLRQGVIAGRYPAAQGGQGSALQVPEYLNSLFYGDGGNIRFN